ncbi:MAG: ABC transporter permease [Candidatus Cloacimonetes bacterium]|jgi:putative ABC transport system permease protein|nr:ABC transporter permease [Candidatus Cloacimonadota bacterium]MDD4155201.1 ABC transporter permease [Candidatus Cloacimonadota bacterium]
MSLLIGAFTMGIILSLLSLGMLLSFKMIKFTDITVDGSLTLGASICSLLILNGFNPWIATLSAFIVGAGAGFVTGFMHTKFKVQQILSGILVMTALYSINLRIMGRSNISLINLPTVFDSIKHLLKFKDKTFILGWEISINEITVILSSFIIILIIGFALYTFLKTNFGTALRATGNNQQMVKAQGINHNYMIVFTLALSNALVAASGGLLAQYQGFADIQMGIGMMVWGLASIIIGEALIAKHSIGLLISGTIFGTIIFRLLIAMALRWGLNPNDLKLVTALFVFIALTSPMYFKYLSKKLFKGAANDKD